jgi:hypothetical protein
VSGCFFHLSFYLIVLVIAAKRQMSIYFSALSWREQIAFGEMMMIFALY